MKIYCDFCGAQIETTVNKSCPNCGGYYSSDRELLDEKERVKKLNELDMEKRKLELENLRLENSRLGKEGQKQGSSAAKGCLIGVVTGLSLLGIVFVIIMIFVFSDISSDKNREKVPDTTRMSFKVSIDTAGMPDIPDVSIPEVPEITVTVADISVPEVPDIVVPEISSVQ